MTLLDKAMDAKCSVQQADEVHHLPVMLANDTVCRTLI